jgi:hypothetical protein
MTVILTVQPYQFDPRVQRNPSAPLPVHARAPNLAETYSRRAESTSVSGDRDAAVRTRSAWRHSRSLITSKRSPIVVVCHHCSF